MGRLIRASAGEASHEWTHHDGFITSHALSTPAHSTTSVMDYTPEGQLAAVTVGDATTRYSYDMAGQLTSAVSPTTTNAWTYDLAGRIVTETIDHETWHRVHNAAGELPKKRPVPLLPMSRAC